MNALLRPGVAPALLAAVHQHPALAPALAKLAEAQTDVELARAEKRPDWSAELDYAQRGADFSNLVSLEFHIGLPLFARHRQNPVIAAKLSPIGSSRLRIPTSAGPLSIASGPISSASGWSKRWTICV